MVILFTGQLNRSKSSLFPLFVVFALVFTVITQTYVASSSETGTTKSPKSENLEPTKHIDTTTASGVNASQPSTTIKLYDDVLTIQNLEGNSKSENNLLAENKDGAVGTELVVTEKSKLEKEVANVCDETNSENWFIYCSGRLLDAVNKLSLFRDSKTFVDRPMKSSAKEVHAKFQKQFPEVEPSLEIDRENLSRFIEDNFQREGMELMTCELNDWQENPPLISMIKDETLREWAMDLNKMWKKLCRQMIPPVMKNPDRYSLLYVPKPFVIPGGRFREFYYWDAYWIIKGLIASGMVETSKHMIENFLHMVEKYGFIPNGGRVYYLKRSQPPLLTGMVYEYYEATHDYEFVARALPILEKEVAFWHQRRSIEVEAHGRIFNVFQYRAESNVPRPESYREDVELVKQITKPEEKRRIWRDVATAAESGWDFSTRWFRNPEKHDLHDIETTNVIEVDLNAYMCWNYDIISYLFLEMGNESKSNEYRERHYYFREVFQKVFYVRGAGTDKAGWYDYNIRSKKHNMHFYPSIAVPLFTRCYHSINLAQSQRIFRTMEDLNVFRQAGGVPTSLLKNSGQQWDWPNGWSPLNHMIIEGLRRSENPVMQQKAFWLAEKWVLSNYRVYRATHSSMWEKYNVIGITPNLGSGGEYEVQAGFGWTNGVILDLLTTYNDRMHFHNLEENPGEVAKKVINNEPRDLPKPVISENDVNSEIANGKPIFNDHNPPFSMSLNGTNRATGSAGTSLWILLTLLAMVFLKIEPGQNFFGLTRRVLFVL